MPRDLGTAASRFSLGLLLVVLLATLARLPGLDAPLTGHHSWRQSDTAAMARNFAEEQFNILNPRIDWRRDTTGHDEGRALPLATA